MVVKVVDASAIGALLFGEPEAPIVAERMTGANLIAPVLLRFEVVNICLKKIRRTPAQRDTLAAAFNLLDPMEIRAVDVEHSEVFNIAEKHRLTAYDASYLWLARKLGAELVTLDKRLEAAWTMT